MAQHIFSRGREMTRKELTDFFIGPLSLIEKAIKETSFDVYFASSQLANALIEAGVLAEEPIQEKNPITMGGDVKQFADHPYVEQYVPKSQPSGGPINNTSLTLNDQRYEIQPDGSLKPWPQCHEPPQVEGCQFCFDSNHSTSWHLANKQLTQQPSRDEHIKHMNDIWKYCDDICSECGYSFQYIKDTESSLTALQEKLKIATHTLEYLANEPFMVREDSYKDLAKEALTKLKGESMKVGDMPNNKVIHIYDDTLESRISRLEKKIDLVGLMIQWRDGDTIPHHHLSKTKEWKEIEEEKDK